MEDEYFKTDNMAVAAYLDQNGIQYERCETGIGRNGKMIVIFVFRDSSQRARDLEKSFRNSKEKKYRDSLLFFRNEIYRVTDKDLLVKGKGRYNEE